MDITEGGEAENQEFPLFWVKLEMRADVVNPFDVNLTQMCKSCCVEQRNVEGIGREDGICHIIQDCVVLGRQKRAEFLQKLAKRAIGVIGWLSMDDGRALGVIKVQVVKVWLKAC